MADGMTERQREILHFCQDFLGEYGEPATVREIKDAFEIKSTNGVMCHLYALERKGYMLHRDKKRWIPRERSIYVDCPHCGYEVEAVEQYEE